MKILVFALMMLAAASFASAQFGIDNDDLPSIEAPEVQTVTSTIINNVSSSNSSNSSNFWDNYDTPSNIPGSLLNTVWTNNTIISFIRPTYPQVVNLSANLTQGAGNVYIRRQSNFTMTGITGVEIEDSTTQPPNQGGSTDNFRGFIHSGCRAGIFTEVGGEVLSFGINVGQLVLCDLASPGGIFRFDTRTCAGCEGFHVLLRGENDPASGETGLHISGETGNVHMNWDKYENSSLILGTMSDNEKLNANGGANFSNGTIYVEGGNISLTSVGNLINYFDGSCPTGMVIKNISTNGSFGCQTVITAVEKGGNNCPLGTEPDTFEFMRSRTAADAYYTAGGIILCTAEVCREAPNNGSIIWTNVVTDGTGITTNGTVQHQFRIDGVATSAIVSFNMTNTTAFVKSNESVYGVINFTKGDKLAAFMDLQGMVGQSSGSMKVKVCYH